ncbi:hypothetical protein BASA83_008929 [Batrachochytrium salamandrivorans]|nr:hypothetical protein BASA83_008929 [Batrachochytrium salamandrivorans]
MKTAAILVISLLAIIGGAAPAPALDDDNLQLYKRQAPPPPPPPPPAPPLPPNFVKSKPNDGTKNVKTTVHNRPAGGSGSSRVSRPNGQSQPMQMPKYSIPFDLMNQRKRPWDNGSNGGGSVNNNPNPNPNSAPKSRHQPKTPGKTTASVSSQQFKIVHTGAKGIPLPLSPPPFRNRNHSPSNWKLPINVGGSKKSSSVATISQTSPSAGGKSPNFDPSQVRLKPVMQKPKPEPPAFEPHLFQIQLRKTPGKTTASVSTQQFKIVHTGAKGTPPPRPSWSPNFVKSKPNDGAKNVKTTVHNRPAGGSGSSRVSRPSGQSQSMQMPKYSIPFDLVKQRKMLWDNGSNGGGSVNNNPNPNLNSVPKSRHQPKTPGKTTASVSSQQFKIVHTGAKGTPPPRPSWSPNFTKSKPNDGTKNVKTTVHNRLAGGSGSSRVSQPNGQSQSMQMPKYSIPLSQ